MKGIYITSKNNNTYFYNNDTGFIELVRGEIPNQTEDTNIEEKEDNEIRWAEPEEIKKDLFAGGFRQLILEVTQNCNLACKYCCFGQHYQSTRKPTTTMMTYEIGKKAVDYYMKVFGEKTYMNPGKNPSIGFYGGEPLLNFPLIKQLVEYVHAAYPQYKYDHNITTNGILLTDEVMDFLVEYGFSVVVSLDGDKENHDRNRVKPNGEGSYDQVIANVERFRERYPDYGMLGFSTCYDYGSDLESLKNFIEEKDLFIVALNMISTIETDYYDQFTEEDQKKFIEQYCALEKEFLERAKKNEVFSERNDIYKPLFLVSYLDTCAHSIMTQKRKEFLPYGGCCVPGDKIFVSASGQFHACERITCHFPIGDVDTGLDFDKITDLINTFNANQPKCKKCDVSRLCNLCYSKFTCKDKIVIDEGLCNKLRNDVAGILVNYINIMEESPETFDRLTTNYFRDLSEITNGTLF